MAQKLRLDALLVERGLAESRARAQALVLAGLVWSDGKRLNKPGGSLVADTPLELRGRDHPWVSRGGVKLAHAIDIGASTGGFTDVLLTRGARRVHAVDVGHGQLAWKLRQNPRVVVLERRNARYLTSADVPEAPDIIVCDASFIGLATVLPAALALAAPVCALVALIKPQFEVGKGQVGKGGVVRDPALHREVCARIAAWLDAQPGWHVEGLTESPLRGPDGNVEFLIYARRTPP
jgi:23S rRNA (cytidine1920-2'-O)/16S rRNA (cytidine1409-2'-O)-methyltransferase